MTGSTLPSFKPRAAPSCGSSISDDPIPGIARLLVNRRDLALRRRVTPSGLSWYASRTSLTLPELAHAVTGQGHLALYAVNTEGMSRWTGLDADDNRQFLRLAAHLATLPDLRHVYVEESARGGHVFLFHQPVPWHTAALTGEQLALEADLGPIEVYPRHAGLHALGVPGSRHLKTNETYPAVDLATGEVLDAVTALGRIHPTTLPEMHFRMLAPTGRSAPSPPGAFDDLVDALAHVTRVRVYGPDKGIARCPFHDDRHPSLLIKGHRFHCLSARCGAWGDLTDVRRFTELGIRPPTN